MEIKEIVSYSVLPNANTLEVAFRTIDDSDEEIRNIELEYDIPAGSDAVKETKKCFEYAKAILEG